MSDKRDEQCAFSLMPMLDHSAPIVSVGIPDAAWKRIRNGETHTIDLVKVGVPFRLMLFGAATNEAAVTILMDAAKLAGLPVYDERRRDLSIEPGTGVPKK